MKGVNATTAILTNTNNTFTGGLAFENGNVTVNSIGMIGSPSAAGSGGILQFGSGFGGGTLKVTGAGNFTTDRVVNMNFGFNGGAIDQSGASGLLKFTADMTATSVGSPTFTLQGSTAGEGEFAGKIVDNGTVGTTLVKDNAKEGSTTLKLYSVDGITIGAAVSGNAFIQPGTTVSAINTGTKVITINPATSGGQVNQNTAITVDGVVNITHVVKKGTGTWILSGENTYSGTTWVDDGMLVLAGSSCLSDTAALRIDAGEKVQLNDGVKERVGSLVIAGDTKATGTTWGAVGNTAADYTDGVFLGTGLIYVGFDPPGGGTLFMIK